MIIYNINNFKIIEVKMCDVERTYRAIRQALDSMFSDHTTGRKTLFAGVSLPDRF